MILKVLPFLEGNATLQMELDRRLLDMGPQDRSSATVRFYRINPVAVTMGYHQEEASLSRVIGDESVEIVRRPTGGRAVIHSGDLTYSLISSLDRNLFGTGTLEIYRFISRGVKNGIARLGVDLDLIGSSKGGASPLCFRAGSRHELSYRGRKVCGGALLRTDGRFLFQGSILADSPSEKFTPEFEGTISLSEIAGRRLEVRHLVEMIEDGFEKVFQARICHQKWPMDLLDKKPIIW